MVGGPHCPTEGDRASIAKAADVELLYDRPYEDRSKVRVAGPFTVESLSPHRVVPSDEEELIDLVDAGEGARRRLHKTLPPTDFADMVLEHLRTAGVHQTEKRDTIHFTALNPWPGEYVGAEGRFMEGETERRAAIFIGPEFGTLSRVDLVAAAREAMDARFDALIACAFAFDAHASEVSKLGPLPILKAKMNPDLHMAGDLKNTGKGNLFVVFGEPDIDIEHETDGRIKVRVKGVDVYDPNTGEIRSNDTKGIAAWFKNRHGLQRGKLLCPPRVFPRRERPLQEPQGSAARRDRRGGLGLTLPRRVEALRAALDRQDRGEGHQPLRGRSDEGVQGVKMVSAKDKNTFQVTSSWLVTQGARRLDLSCSELSATFDFISNYRILLRLQGKNEPLEDRGVTLLTVDLDELLELLGDTFDRLNFDMVEYRDTVVKASSQERLRSELKY